MKFITLSNQRSGSSFFQRLLDSHPNILARQEDLRNINSPDKVKDILDSIFAQEEKVKVVGTKVQYDQASDGLLDYIKKNDVKVIQVIRKDLLETALWFPDHFIGKREGGLGVGIKVEEPVETKVEVVIDYLQWLRQQIKKYRELANLTVYYEDFTNNENSEVFYNKNVQNWILDYLGVEQRNLWVSQKINNKPKRKPNEELIKNYEDLMFHLKSRGIRLVWDEV